MFADQPLLRMLTRSLMAILLSGAVLHLSGCAPEERQNGDAPDTEQAQPASTANSTDRKQPTELAAAESPPQKPTDTEPDDDSGEISLLTDPGSASMTPELAGEYPIDKIRNYTETGDLDAIKAHGKLRILVDIGNIASLHRAATRQDMEIDQARRLAERLGLEPVVLYVNNFSELIDHLKQGKGDIIANDLVITDERKKVIDFSTPVADTQLVLVSHSDTPDIDDSPDLKEKVIAVTRGTVFEPKAREWAKQHPDVTLRVVDTNYVDLAVEVAQKDIDFTILDDAALNQVMQFRDELKKNHVFPEKRQIAWAIRKNSPQFMQAINEKIRHIKLTRSTRRATGDLDEIQKRGVIRVVTRNNPGSYFMWKGRVLGYEFELAEAFAKAQKLRLEVIVAPDHTSFIKMLQDGKADIAANLLAPHRAAQSPGNGVQRCHTHCQGRRCVTQRGRNQAVAGPVRADNSPARRQ